MDGLVSVVVFCAEEQQFLQRCINAVNRQTYKDYELIYVGRSIEADTLQGKFTKEIIVEDEKSIFSKAVMSEIVEQSKGEKLFFVESTYSCSPHTLEYLLGKTEVPCEIVYAYENEASYEEETDETEEIEKVNALFRANLSLMDKKKFTKNDLLNDFGFGILYEKETFQKQVQEAEESDNAFSVSCIGYAAAFDTVETVEEALIITGQSENEVLSLQGIAPAALKDCVSLFSRSTGVSEGETIKNVMEKYSLEDREYINSVMMYYAKQEATGKEALYYLCGKYTRAWYKEAVEEKDAEQYGLVKDFLTEIEKDDLLLNVMLRECEITKDQYSLMKEKDIMDYAFFYDKLADSQLTQDCAAEIKKAQRTLQEMEKKLLDKLANQDMDSNNHTNILKGELDQIKDMQSQVRTEVQVVTERVELEGPELAQHMIDQCYSGKMGLGTIFKCFKGCISYKVHRK